MSQFRTFGDQSRHYFTRAHQNIPNGPLSVPAAWRGEHLRDRAEAWLIEMTSAQQQELLDAVVQVESLGIPMESISQENFALPTLGDEVARWAREIQFGRGFVVVRGLPIDEWGVERAALAYWGIGHYLGLPGAQNPANELLGHVVDYGEEADNPVVRRYRTTGNIDFHCDAADVVGLLCLHTAKQGGQSRIVSSVSVYNEIQATRPDLIPLLFEPMALDLRGEEKPGQPGYSMLTPCCFTETGGLKTFYHSEYFRSAERHADIQFSDDTHALLDLYDGLCLKPELQLDMWLEPGDMQFISNHTIIHARTEYQDWPEPERKRHLLRLWLSLEG